MQPAAFADSLKDAAAAHHGHAGRRWLEYLTSHYAEARDALRQLRDGFAEELAPNDAAGAVRRVAQRFALIAAAGELAAAAGITDWPVGEAQRAAASCFAAWLGQRGTAGAPEPLAMLRQVRQFLEAHGESRFTPLDDDPKRDTVNRAGFRRSVESGTEFLVLREAFRSELSAGFDVAAVAAALAAVGALKLDSDGAKTRKEYLPGIGRERCYVITPAVWGASP
jgi:putative DNA primase/helicase